MDWSVARVNTLGGARLGVVLYPRRGIARDTAVAARRIVDEAMGKHNQSLPMASFPEPVPDDINTCRERGSDELRLSTQRSERHLARSSTDDDWNHARLAA